MLFTDHTHLRTLTGALLALVVLVAAGWTGLLQASVRDANAATAAPIVQSVSPAFGPPSGGTRVVIQATNVDQVTAVHFGAAAADVLGTTQQTPLSTPPITLITVAAPRGTGVVDVTVTGPAGTSAPIAQDRFTYAPIVTSLTPNAGVVGTSVQIRGFNFGLRSGTGVAVTGVSFGGTPAANPVQCRFVTLKAGEECLEVTAPAARGVVDVTLTGPGGTSELTENDEFAYAPEIDSISPTAGAQGTQVTIQGVGFLSPRTSSALVTGVSFGGTAARFSVLQKCGSQPGTRTANPPCVVALAPAGNGVVDVTLTSAGGTSPITPADEFSYAPEVTSIAPTAGQAGTQVTIEGQGFADRAGHSLITGVSFGDTPAAPFNVENPCPGAKSRTPNPPCVVATAPPGNGVVDVRLTSAGGTSAITPADEFSYAPEITSISPSAGRQGSRVLIQGSGFVGVTAVRFGDTPAASFALGKECPIARQACLEAIAPAGTGVVDVRVTSAGGTSEITPADQFSYAPEITSISPQFGPAAGGTQVQINGLGFRPGMDVKFGDTRATIVSVNVGGTQITVNSPPGTGIVDVTVTNAGGTSAITSHDQFTYVSAIPSVTSIAPASGPAGGGTSVVIQGTAFTGALSVAFGGSNAASFKLDSDTQITATAPAGAGTVHVRVTTPGGVSGVSADDEFTYLPAPAVTAISPTSGPAGGGTQVTITGTALTGATDVRFGSTPASGFSVNSDTHITAHTPPGSGTVHVTVSTPDGTSATSSADQFTYVPAPMVTSVVPNSGPVTGKTTIVITGTAFTGATAVSLTVPGNSTPVASFTVDSDTQITAVTPATGAPGAVDVRVTTPSGTSPQSASDVFTYSAATTGGPAGRAYVANSGDNTISVIDTSTNKVLRTMAVPAAADQPGVAPAPDALALDSAGTHLFVAGRGNNTIYAMDAATGNVASTFNTLASGGACGPMGLALSLDGSRLYVEGSTCTTATVLDAGNPSHLALVANIATVAEGGKVAVSSSSGRAYFGDNGAVISGGGLQSVNTATNTVVGPVDHTGAVFGVSVTHVPQDFSCPQPVLWYASAQTVVQTLIGLGCGSGTTGASFGTALRGVSSVRGPSTLMAAVADQANTLWIVTPSGDVGIAGNPVSVGNGPLGTALANDLSRAYVTNSTDGTVSVVDPSALTVVTTISVGPSPTDILFSPNIPPGG